MSFLLSGVFDQKTADDLSQRAASSDRLGYPTAAIFEQADNPALWHINIYLQDLFSADLLAQELGPNASLLTMSNLPENIDWVSESLKGLQPVAVGRYFVHGSHDRDQVRAYHHAVCIDANQAFGTGHHGTTAGCLEAIASVTSQYDFKTMLDLGTGSGVLAAALAMTTRRAVLATDIDPVATRIARENMQKNGLANLVTCVTATGFHHPCFQEKGPFGLVVANILAGPLRALAQPMSRHLADHAIIILSGLLISQKASVLSAYREQGAYLVRAIHREGWATLILQRP